MKSHKDRPPYMCLAGDQNMRNGTIGHQNSPNDKVNGGLLVRKQQLSENVDAIKGETKRKLLQSLDSFTSQNTPDDDFSSINFNEPTQFKHVKHERLRLYSLNFLNEDMEQRSPSPEMTPENQHESESELSNTPLEIVTKSEFKQAQQWSAKANSYYKMKEYFDCLCASAQSLGVLKSKVGEVPSLQVKLHDKQVYELMKDCYLQSASCYIRLNDSLQAIKLLTTILYVECNRSLKALYLRGCAYQELYTTDHKKKNIINALRDFQQAHKIAPTNKIVFNYMTKLRIQVEKDQTLNMSLIPEESSIIASPGSDPVQEIEVIEKVPEQVIIEQRKKKSWFSISKLKKIGILFIIVYLLYIAFRKFRTVFFRYWRNRITLTNNI